MPSFEIEVARVTTRMGRFLVHDQPDKETAEELGLKIMGSELLAQHHIKWDAEESAASKTEMVSCQQQP